MTKKVIAELRDFLETSVFRNDPNSYVIFYGGSIYKKLSHSDIDLAIITTEPSRSLSKLLESFIIDLHRRHNLHIDTEVPYSNKLLYAKADIETALALECFVEQNSTSYKVPRVKKNSEFLSSPEIKARLILNALTTPHEFWGNATTSASDEIRADLAITVLSIGLIGKPEFSRDELESCLVLSEHGEEGELYLGYKTDYNIVKDYLQGCLALGLSMLGDAGHLISVDGHRWRRCDDYVSSNALNLSQKNERLVR